MESGVFGKLKGEGSRATVLGNRSQSEGGFISKREG